MIQNSSIDFTKVYEVKPKLIEKDPTNLSSYGKSSYPDTSKLIYCPFNFELNRFSTGLDVTHPRVLMLPPEERKVKIKEIEEIKADLEDKIGVDLSPRSTFYDEFAILIGNDSKGDVYMNIKGTTYTLDPQKNPFHKLALIILKFNNLLPSSKEEAASPTFRGSKYLLTTEDEINQDAKEKIRIDILRGKNLSELFGDEIKYERAWELAYYLGYGPKKNMSEDLLQELLYEKTLVLKEAKRFNTAYKLDNQKLTISNLFKKALKLNIIRFNKTDNCFYRGAVNYRDNEEGSIELLMTEPLSVELAQLKEKVALKSKTMKNLS